MKAAVAKALEAAAAARLLLAAKSFDAAANRAYYAMFDCARLLLRAKHAMPTQATRKHATTIEQFSLFFAKTGVVDRKHGRALKNAFEARALADYSDESVSEAQAEKIVTEMEAVLPLLEDQPA